MAKVNAVSAPSATTETTLYTATADGVANILIINRGSSAGTVRVAIRDGSPTTDEDYILYDTAIQANEPFEITTGLVLENGDVVTVYASSGDFSFRISVLTD